MKVKTLTCFLVAFLMLSGAAFCEPITVPNYSFEYVGGELIHVWTDGVTPDYWTFASGNDDDGVEDPSTDGEVCVAVGDTDSVFQLLDHTIYPGDEYVLKVDARFLWSGDGSGSSYECTLYFDNGLVRVPIASAGGVGVLYTWLLDNEAAASIPVESSAIGKKLGIELAALQAPNNWFGFDNVRLDLTQQVVRSEDPSPTDKADRVLLDTVLSWSTGRDPNNPGEINSAITNHFLYMSGGDPADPNVYYVATVPAGDPPAATAQYVPPMGLERDKTYYWRVDEGLGENGPEDAENIAGIVWSFQTVLSVPMLDADLPADKFAFPEETVVFTVDAVNPYTMDYTGMSYEWRKAGNPDVLSSTDTLEISNVQAVDDGDYYCTVTIDANGHSAVSREALLVVKRMIGHWKFEGNLVDEIAGRIGSGNVSYLSGIDGQCIQFIGDGHIVEIADSTEAFNFYPRGYTLNAWAKTSQCGWGALIAKQYRPEDDVWKGFVLNHYTSSAVHSLRQGFDDVHSEGVAVNDDQWHMITATYDSISGIGTIYVDGVKRNESDPVSSEINTNELPLVFGAETVEGDVSAYLGQLDDVRIWNYPVDKYEIADLYLEYSSDESVCIDPIEYDLNGDCSVNFEDILVISERWLSCNIVPTCE